MIIKLTKPDSNLVTRFEEDVFCWRSSESFLVHFHLLLSFRQSNLKWTSFLTYPIVQSFDTWDNYFVISFLDLVVYCLAEGISHECEDASIFVIFYCVSFAYFWTAAFVETASSDCALFKVLWKLVFSETGTIWWVGAIRRCVNTFFAMSFSFGKLENFWASVRILCTLFWNSEVAVNIQLPNLLRQREILHHHSHFSPALTASPSLMSTSSANCMTASEDYGSSENSLTKFAFEKVWRRLYEPVIFVFIVDEIGISLGCYWSSLFFENILNTELYINFT